ncbi:MAG TPA: efflux RND transporter periplasmic adaptor subunit [Gemmatimonadaceae bacterium]|jgi:RND family efflux transporter MFP subunit|nr:efflux RND transporter periplasmic adaptor subunit [Gemmatimonadaceae bacterium]
MPREWNRPSPAAGPRLGAFGRRLAGGTLGIALLALAAACNGASEAATADEDSAGAAVTLGPRDVAVARTIELGSSVTLRGSLEPAQTVTVKSQVAGTVRNLRVDRGSDVRRGQVLATIEAAGVQSQAAGARAQVAAAEAALALARQRLEGARKLHAAGAMSDIDFRSAEANYEAAEAQLAAARAQAATAGEAARRTTVTAPLTGSVSQRFVEEGEAVGSSDNLLTVVDTRVLELAGQVGIEEAQRVRVGQPVVFILDASPNQELRGRVARVDPRADPGTRQVGVYVQLPNSEQRIIAGQFARGRVITGTASREIAVPTTAVRDTGAAAHVFVIENGRLAKRQVSLGARDESQGLVAIASGVREGERVLASPAPGTTDGLLVTVVADTSARAQPAAAPSPSNAEDTARAARPLRAGGQ